MISALPPDIWKNILIQLCKSDIREASGVCRIWNKIAIFIFGDHNITISLCSYQYDKLLKDFRDYPLLAYRVNEIIVFSEAGNDDTINTLRAILRRCPNLIALRFTEKHVYGYLKMLTSKNMVLPRIQDIDVLHLQENSAAIKRIMVWINHKYRDTIRCLQFMDVQGNTALKQFGGLMNYTTLFPQLSHIKVLGDWKEDNKVHVDLNELLMKNTKLETIIMGNIAYVSGKLSKLPLLSEDLSYPSLSELRLYRFETDITLLDYIATRCDHLEELFFVDVIVMPNKAVNDGAAAMIIETFNTMPANRVCLSYNYKDNCYNTFMNIAYLPQWSNNVGYADRYVEKVYTYDLCDA